MANTYYSAPVKIRQSAATASGATVWSMRNSATSTITVFIERIELLMAFDSGTPLTRSLQLYDLVRFSTATPTGGTQISVAQMYSGDSGTQVTDVRFLDTGLTTTSVVFNPPFCTIGCPATDATTTKYQREGIALLLGVGEGFCIKLNGAAVIGQSLTGEIVWSER
jgi:hypothetical protein